MPESDQVVRNARRAAQSMGGLIGGLLSPQSRKAKKVKWDPTRARFRGQGQIVNIARVRRELFRVEGRMFYLMDQNNKKLWSGEWSLFKWKEAQRRVIQDTHMISGGLALGSLTEAGRSDVVSRRIARDLKALDRYEKAYKQGKLTLGTAHNRNRAYARSPYVTYHLLSQRQHILAGFKLARRKLSPAEHCHTKGDLEGCFEAAARDWMDIRKLPPIGTLVCMQFCKCWVQYR